MQQTKPKADIYCWGTFQQNGEPTAWGFYTNRTIEGEQRAYPFIPEFALDYDGTPRWGGWSARELREFVIRAQTN